MTILDLIMFGVLALGFAFICGVVIALVETVDFHE